MEPVLNLGTITTAAMSSSTRSSSSSSSSQSDGRKSLRSLSSSASEAGVSAQDTTALTNGAGRVTSVLSDNGKKRELRQQEKQEHRTSLVPSHWEDSVRYIGVSECRAAGLSLSHSFADDDLSRYLLDTEDMAHHSDEARWKLHVLIMTGIVASHCLRGSVSTIGPDHDAVAIWQLPNKETDGMWTLFRSGMWRLFYKLSREGRKRYYDELMPVLHDVKAEVMGDRDSECYYLVYIGTKSGSRGRGYASKLINDIIVKADAEQRAIYLESSSLANDAYYAKFGFEFRRDIYLGKQEAVVDVGTTKPAPVRLSVMVREPRPVKSQA